MNILITGAQLANKGAESMLYIVTDEMKKRFPDAIIYFATNCDYDESKYTFKKFFMSERGLDIAIGGPRATYAVLKGILKDTIKICIGKRKNLGHFYDVRDHFGEMDMMIDVSGFNIGKQWSKGTHRIFMNRIELAKRNNIPVYLMPQSFGPFDYDANMKSMKTRMEELLPYPKLIFAREKEGYNDLIKTFDLHNVVLSTDLVLQNTGIDWRNVFTSEPVINVPAFDSYGDIGGVRSLNEDVGSDYLKVVGVVPNKQCFNHGDMNWNLKIYQAVIDQLLSDGYRVVIFRHSREDLEIGKIIKERYKATNDVYLETKEFSCFEYDVYVKQFQFIICSRFHGIVHAYRNGVPSIALGWAIKYLALAKCVDQGQYSFDITEGRCSIEEIIGAVKDMEINHEHNSVIIRKCVQAIQKENCFDMIQVR